MIDGLREKLLKKGWDSKDIDYTFSIMKSADKNKHKKEKIFEKILYWLAMVIAIVGNMIISVALIPFFLILHASVLYLVIIMLGIGFGFLYDILIWDIKKVTGKDMVIENIFIPALALVNVSFMTYFGNLISRELALVSVHNPFLVGFVYMLAFIAPWITREYILEKGF